MSVRTPDSTSRASTSSFNRFSDLLKSVLDKYDFETQDIYNMDKTGVTTSQTAQEIVARKGLKQIGKVTSAEREHLVTFASTVSVNAIKVPPFLDYRNHLVKGRPSPFGEAKAGERDERKKKKAAILIGSPVKHEIELERTKRIERKMKTLPKRSSVFPGEKKDREDS
ncbi:hypothetical protein ILUMI_16137 [Ignelater luminosus]|uniref:Uncharacterized protein n=1 Tax=Ignelater luminosus TaxID=2038154 RepID=A0A8K0CRS7_IGNLU|nr:hypothetical protein ILUMI_16137 [Ignelater luminosus]